MMTMTRTLGGLILTLAAATGLGGLENEARAQAFGFHNNGGGQPGTGQNFARQFNGGGRPNGGPNFAGQFNTGGRFNGGPNFGFNYNRTPFIPAAAYGRQLPRYVTPRVYCPPVYRAPVIYPAPAYRTQPVQAYPAPAPYCAQPVQAYPAPYYQGGTTVTVIVR